MFEKVFGRGKKSDVNELGVFSEMHRYFFDKYRANKDCSEFYVQVQYFFRALMVVLAGEVFDEDASEGSVEYHRLIQALGEHTIESRAVVHYLLTLAHKTRAVEATNSMEAAFYQSYLIGQGLSLLFSKDLTDEEFDSIVNQIPGEMLLNEQESSCVGKDTLRSSNMLVQLCESHAPTAIYRYCKLVSLFPTSDIRAERYLSSVVLLKTVDTEQAARVKIMDEISENQVIQAAIFQVLLLSVRLKDQKAAKEAFKTKSADTHFMIETLCEESFLASLVTKGVYGSPLGHPACVYELFVFCMNHGTDVQNNLIVKQLNWAVSDYAEKNNQAPLVRVSSLFGINGAKFFGMLDPEFAKMIYTRKLFDRFIQKLKSDSNLSDKKQIQLAVISFISLSLHVDPDDQSACDYLFQHCDEIFLATVAIRTQVVELIAAYLTNQMLLYPKAPRCSVFAACMEKLKT